MKILAWFIAFIRAPFILYFDLGGGQAAPAPDPNIGIAAAQNSAVAADALAFNKQVYAANQPRQAAADALATQVVNQQLAIGADNQAHAAQQWNQYLSLYAPNEAQMVADATGIDSAANLAVASGNAASTVQAQSDNANAQMRRQQQSTGVNPNSGRAQALASESALTTAAQKANASTTAAQNLHSQGITLRAGVANFGRNMPNTAANAYGTALNSGNSATANQSAPISSSISSAGQMNQGYGTATNGYSASGNLSLGSYNSQLNAWNAQQQANASSSAGLGNMVGTLGAAYMMMPSSKNLKHKKAKINHGKTLDKVIDLPVEDWSYLEGKGDSGDHAGPYAEDVQKKFGDRAAPGGKMIDMITMQGITLSAIKGLAAKTDKLETKVAKIAASRGVKGA